MLTTDHYSDHMARSVTATEAKAHLLALLDEVESGEEIEITRHGRLVARIVPTRGGAALAGRFKGLVTILVDEEELIHGGPEWDLASEEGAP